MTKEEYEDFVLRYKGCGACFPMYHTLSRFEKMWFSAIQKDVAELEKENAELKKENKVLAQNLEDTEILNKTYEKRFSDLEKENAELKKKNLDTQDAVTMQMYTNKANKEIADRQLTNAKEIIKKLKALYFSPVVTKDDVKRQDEILAEVEQFLNSEVNNVLS